MNEITTPLGAFIDTRTDEEKSLDYTHTEVLAGSTSPNWINKPLVTLDQRYQLTSTSCISQSCAKGITKFTGYIASALPIFDSRSNYPQAAQFLQEGASIAKVLGTDFETKYPSQNMTDDQLNAMKVAFTNMPFKIANYYTLPAGQDLNMDLYAQALDQGHALLIGLDSNADEWNYVPIENGAATFSHCVSCHSGNYLIEKNPSVLNTVEKALGIDDSANHSSSVNGQRILLESFLHLRSWGVIALIPLAVIASPKPLYDFKEPLAYGLMNNPDVVALQNILKYENCMSSSIPSTGNYLQATKAAVKALQEKYADMILVPAGINTGIGTGNAGVHTIEWLNNKYSV